METVHRVSVARNLTKISLAAALFSVVSFTASAVPITFSGGGTGPGGQPVAATTTFDLTGTTLTITLQNIAGSNPGQDVPGSTLTGLFFDLTGNPTLTPVSATIPAGSSIINPAACSTGNCVGATNVGGEWGYGTSGADGGVGSAGYLSTGAAGNIGNFNNGVAGTNLDNPNSLDGINFGIISAVAGFAPNGGLGSEPLIQDTVIFVLTGAGLAALTTADISNVSFQYGTQANELNIPGTPTIPPGEVPEPGTLALLGLGLFALVGLRRNRA